jgi:hypothetical protein
VWSNHVPKNLPLFGSNMVEMWLLWAPHTSWCIQVSRNAPHAVRGEHRLLQKSITRGHAGVGHPVLMPTYTSVPFSAAYYQMPVLYTSNVAPNKVHMEMYIEHTREKHINTEICLITAPKKKTRHKWVSGSQGHDPPSYSTPNTPSAPSFKPSISHPMYPSTDLIPPIH